MNIHTLTIDDNGPIQRFAFATEAECYAQLRKNYPGVAEFSDDGLVTELTENLGVVFYIDSHEIDLDKAHVVAIDFSPEALDEHLEGFEAADETDRFVEIWSGLDETQRKDAAASAMGFFEHENVWEEFHECVVSGILTYAAEQLS